MKKIETIPYGILPVKVTGEDGTFYDLVRSFEARVHLDLLIDGGYKAEIVPLCIGSTKRQYIPPCIMRDFTSGLDSYIEVSYLGGGDFYHKGED